MCWIPCASGSFRPGAFAIAGVSGGASFFAGSCKTGSEDDGEAGAGEGALAAGAAAQTCRVCNTGSEDDGAAGVAEATPAPTPRSGASEHWVCSARFRRGASGLPGVQTGSGDVAPRASWAQALALPPQGVPERRGNSVGPLLGRRGAGAEGAAGAGALTLPPPYFPPFARHQSNRRWRPGRGTSWPGPDSFGSPRPAARPPE